MRVLCFENAKRRTLAITFIVKGFHFPVITSGTIKELNMGVCLLSLSQDLFEFFRAHYDRGVFGWRLVADFGVVSLLEKLLLRNDLLLEFRDRLVLLIDHIFYHVAFIL